MTKSIILAKPGKPVIFEGNWDDKWFEYSVYPIFDEKGIVLKIAVYSKDITDRINAIEAVRQSERAARALLDATTDAIVLLDKNYMTLDVNEQLAARFNKNIDYFIGKYFHEYIPGQITIDRQKHIDRVFEEKTPVIFEDFRDGRWLENSVYPIMGANNQVISVAFYSKNITDRRLQQEALRESEDRLRTLINSMPDIVCFKDGEGRWLEANEYDVNFFELNGVDYHGKKDSELAEFSSHYRDEFLNCELSDEIAWNVGGLSRGEELITKPDGGSFVFDIIKVATFYPDGRRKGLIVVGRDITERKRAEEALRRSKEQLSLAIDGSGVGLWDWRINEDKIVFNDRLADIIGYSQEELLPMSFELWSKFCHPDDKAASEDSFSKHINGETENYDCEIRLKHKSEQWVWVHNRGKVTQLDENGKPARFTGTIMDINDRKLFEVKLIHSELKFRSLFESLNEGVALYNMIFDENNIPVDYEFIGVNSQFEKTFGLKAEDILYQRAKKTFSRKRPNVS